MGELLITVVSVSMPAVLSTCEYASLHKIRGVRFSVSYVGQGHGSIEGILGDIESADALVIDLMGLSSADCRMIVSAAKKCKGIRVTAGGMAPNLARIGGYDASRFRMSAADEENLHRISQCWKRAETRDMEYIYSLILGHYLGIRSVEEKEYPEVREGVYLKDPDTGEECPDVGSYLSAHSFGKKEGTVMMAYSGSSYPYDSRKVAERMFAALGGFADVIPVAMNSYSVDSADELRRIAGKPDVIVNLLPFRFLAGPMGGDSGSAVDLLREFGAPILSPFIMTGTSRGDWMRSKTGVDAMEFMLDIFLPELDGAVCTIPVGTSEPMPSSEGFPPGASEIDPLDDRISRIAGKVRGLLRLRHKSETEKKVAIIAYNYPPGEGELFGGSFIDGAGSLSSILSMLATAGYDTVPMSAGEIISRFLSDGILNGGDWLAPTGAVIRSLPRGNHPCEISARWGPEPGKIMVSDGKYLIPGIVDGNVFIGIQPARVPEKGDISGSYHDDSLLPHHQYLAFYEWLQRDFGADAIVHLGTHGTLEFLPGKEQAMSGQCYPDMLMGDLPHFYIYYSGNPSEAMIAKRRSHAAIVSYMPPPFVRSGTYGALAELESEIAELRESSKADSGRAEMLKDSIVRKAAEMRLPTDIEELEDELVNIRNSLIPNGLHVFGKGMSAEDAACCAAESLRFPHDGLPSPESLNGISDGELAEAVSEYAADGRVPSSAADVEGIAVFLEYAKKVMSAAEHPEEEEGLLTALNGGYIEAAQGGDSLKDPEVLPSGRNIVQFNPFHIPTQAAFKRGADAARDLIDQYRRDSGRWPRRVALVLWGLETSRTQGMTIGQICGYLGLRMVSQSGDFVSRFEPIPIEELGRPRIDVTVSMCGFFRDMFPNLVTGLAKIFETVGKLDEPEEQNYIKAGDRRNLEYLSVAGYSGKEAEDLAFCRLFGPERGEYGTSVTAAVKSSSWKEESELGGMFIDSLRFAYTAERRGEDIAGLLEHNYSAVDVVSQVRDSKDREIIDLDHYYEFLGGLSKAVEVSSGAKPEVYVVDDSGPRTKTEPAARSFERGLRTRLLNPKWIDGLLKTEYHGAQKINERFENTLGLAATVGCVNTGAFSDLLSRYVLDKNTRDCVKANNPWAYMSMIKRLSEAYERGYWKATDEELNALKKEFEDVEGELEDVSDR
ncbi:cobaltochelatase subunit CobN [Methanomassiliicoccales archaeon LGM-DZ1]|nr:cobaltochelatase subunit CobN [Methanomassiliicoccales archaeon LGM-DZ1]